MMNTDYILYMVTIFLQRKINLLYNVSCILDLEGQAGESNIVVFCNGGQLAANEKWHIGTSDLNVVSEYTYLRINYCHVNWPKLNLYLKPFSHKGPICSS